MSHWLDITLHTIAVLALIGMCFCAFIWWNAKTDDDRVAPFLWGVALFIIAYALNRGASS